MLLIGRPALAQVSTDDHALDQLAPAPAAAPKAAHAAPRRTAHRSAPARRLATPSMPVLPPANPVIRPPVFAMPPHAPPPPPPVPVRADAPGAVTKLPGGGARITFGPGISDLNPATLAAVQAIGVRAAADPAAIVSVTAWAPGTADDLSTPRRLSLDRALTARAVLIHAGMVSDRIRTVAKGTGDIGPATPDRADVTLGR